MNSQKDMKDVSSPFEPTLEEEDGQLSAAILDPLGRCLGEESLKGERANVEGRG